MSAGVQLDKGIVNGTVGSVVADLHRAFGRLVQTKSWLDSVPDATLLAAPYGFVQADIDDLRSAFSDLNQLNTIYQGGAALAVAKDFRTFAKRLYGFGL